MSRFLLLIWFLLPSVCILAEEKKDPLFNHYAIEVQHNFVSYNNCSGGYPYLKSMKLEANSIDSKYENGFSKIRKINDKNYKATWRGSCDSTLLRNAVLSFDSEIKGLGNKGKDYSPSGKISINSIKDINTLFECGGSVVCDQISDYHHCSPLHTEGYTMTTSVTIDNPISVEILNEDKRLRIDKSDQSMLHLKFGKFYNESNSKRRIEYKVNGDEAWQPISNKDIYIASSGEVYLTYEDIVGENSDSNEDYNKCFAKFMSFRVVKTLLSGDESYANVVSGVRFYGLGPDFEIADVRSPYCREKGLSIRVSINKNEYEKYRNFDGVSWEIKSPNGNQFTLEALSSERDSEGFYELEGNSEGGTSLSSYLADDKNVISGDWLMQLKYDGPQYSDFESFKFSTKTFTIPEAPKNPIEINQLDPLFSIDGVGYHLASSQNPYLAITITDEEKDPTGRLPYEIEIDGNRTLISEVAQISNESQLGITKEQYLKDYQSDINKFKSDKIHQWYSMHQTDGLAKLCKIASSGNNCVDSPENIIVDGNYIFNINTYDLYYINGEWRCSSVYPKAIAVYNEISAIPVTIYGISISENIVQKIHPQKQGSEIYERLQFLSDASRYTYVCGNSQTLIVKANYNDSYFILSLSSNKLSRTSITKPEFVSQNHIMDSHGNVIVLGADKKTVTIYSYIDNAWKKTQYALALAAESVEYIEKDTHGISFKAQDGNYYEQYFDLNETSFGYVFEGGNAYISKTHFDSEIDRYKEQLWQQYIIENCGYRIPLTEDQLNKDETLVLYDRDGCSYSHDFRVNVLKSYEVKTERSHVEDNGDKWAEVSFTPGGSEKLMYNNSVIEQKQSFKITGLLWGRNELSYYYAGVRLVHYIDINPNVSLGTMIPQKCADGYGYIKLEGSDLSKINAVECKNIVNGTTLTFGKVDNIELKAGTYHIRVKFDNFWVDLGTKEITDEIFGLQKTITKNDASEIGGFGSASVSFKNANPADVAWFDESGHSITPDWEHLAPGWYNMVAEYDGCIVGVKFDISAPTFEIVKFDVDQVFKGDAKGEISFAIDGKTSSDIDSYYFTINDREYEKSVCDTFIYTSISETFDVSLHYRLDPYSEYVDLNLASVKTIDFNPTVSENSANQDRCYGSDGKIDIDNKGIDNIKYRIGNGKFYEVTKPISVSVQDSIVVVTLKKTLGNEQLPQCNFGNVKMDVCKSDTINIVQVEPLTFKKEISNVSCRDMVTNPDGGIVISNILNVKGEKGTSVVKVDDSVIEYEKGTDTYYCTSLLSGEHKLYIKDSRCETNSHEETFVIKQPEHALTLSISSVEPSCWDNDGQINVSANGGGDQYAFFFGKRTNSGDLAYVQSKGDMVLGDSDITKRGQKQSLKNKEILESLFYSVNQKDSLKNCPHKTYYVAVCDNNGCVVTASKELKEYTNPSVKDALTDQTSCYGYSDGRIKEIMVETNGKLNGKDVTPSKLFYNFTPKNNDLYEVIKKKELPWTDGIDNLAAGDYELWVEDNNGCMTNNKDGSIGMSFTVGQPEHVQLEVKKIADVSGYDASDAVIKVRADGGNNCDKKIYVKKEEAEDESAATEVREDEQSEDEYFIGEAATRGVEYQIAKYPFAEGTYSFYVRDKEKDCPSNVVNDIVVESPDEPLSADIVVRKALCHNQTGSIDITPRGGWGPPYEVIVDGVRYSATPSNPKITVGKLISGEYTVTVKDARKRVVYTTTADVPMPNDDMSFGEGTMFVADRCSGNGGAHIEIVGGSGEYNIMMDGENYTTDKFDIDGLRAGHYKIDVVDGNKCEAVLEFEIADERLSADILSYNKADDGATLEAVVAGGVEPYSYEWRHVDGLLNQRANVSVIDNLEHGIYTLLVTDAGECHAGPIAKEVVTDGDQRLEVVQLQRETGVGSADGYVVLKSGVTDFVSQKIYHIESDGSSTVSDIKVEWVDGLLKVDNLSSGDYVVKCQHSDNMHFSMARFRIEPYEKLDIEGVEVRHVTMPRNRDGRIRISLKGGIAPFAATVAHNTNAAFEPLTIESGDRCFDMERLMAGEYTLTVTDSTRREANMAVQTFVVEEPEYLSLSADMTPAMCYGEPSGKVKLTATGGWGKYMYEYASNGYEKTTEYRRLFPGMQMFSVIDEYGTRKTIEVMVEQPDEVRTQIAQIDSVDCYGSNTGSVTFQVKGGDSNYTMWYSDKNQDELLYSKADVTHSGLSMGNYRVTFRDGNDCMSVDTITVFIPEPDLLELANDDVVNTTCELDNGKIAIEMKGGSLPYTYSWRENGEEYGGAKTLAMTRSEASGLKQNGLYSIEIVDKNGCKASYEKRIEPSENPRVLGVSTTDVLCYGSSDGVAAVDSAQVKWAYPKADYHLTWPQGQDGVMSVNTLPTGTYIVKITDDNNCSSTTEFTVGTPQPVKNHLVGLRNAMCYGYSDGRIETRTIGGVGDYRYIWSTGEETSYASNLRAGTYKVIVADSHECVDSATFEITEPEELKVNLGEDVIVCPGSSYTFDAGEFASYQWYREDADEVIETERKLTTTDGGNIHILVKNEIGCMARDTVFLGISNEALVANFFVASNVSLNDTVVAIELSNMQPDRIVWEYVNDAFNDVSPSDSTNTYRYLRTEKLGTQYITMWAYKGDCVSSDTKQVDVFENVEVFDDFEIGYDPLIKSVKVAPNPNNGEFFLIITLREVNDVVLRMTDVAGSKVMDRVLSGADYYNEKIDIGKSGIFILTLTVGDEIRSIKILSVK